MTKWQKLDIQVGPTLKMILLAKKEADNSKILWDFNTSRNWDFPFSTVFRYLVRQVGWKLNVCSAKSGMYPLSCVFVSGNQ